MHDITCRLRRSASDKRKVPDTIKKVSGTLFEKTSAQAHNRTTCSIEGNATAVCAFRRSLEACLSLSFPKRITSVRITVMQWLGPTRHHDDGARNSSSTFCRNNTELLAILPDGQYCQSESLPETIKALPYPLHGSLITDPGNRASATDKSTRSISAS